MLLLEYAHRGDNAFEILARIRRASAATRILMIYDACRQDLIVESIRLGARGYLLKSSDRTLWPKAIRAVYAGEPWFGREALLQALQSQICATPAAAMIDEGVRPTPREDEILRFIGAGLTNKEIGRRLEISDNTVKTHLHRTYVKLNQSGRYKAYLSHPEFTCVQKEEMEVDGSLLERVASC